MEDEVSVKEAYFAMFSFLQELYLQYGFDQIGGLLGSMSLLPDGSTSDPAIWGDWMRCVQKAKAGKVDASLRFKEEG